MNLTLWISVSGIYVPTMLLRSRSMEEMRILVNIEKADGEECV